MVSSDNILLSVVDIVCSLFAKSGIDFWTILVQFSHFQQFRERWERRLFSQWIYIYEG